MIYVPHTEIDPAVQRQRSLLFDPSYAETFGALASETFRLSTPLALYDFLELSPAPEIPEDRLIKMGMTPHEIEQYQQQKGREETLTQEEYTASPHFREGKKWFEGMTEDQAEMIAGRADQQERNQFILSHGNTTGHQIAAFAGGLIGAIPDPANFIPILGPALRLAAVARLGRVAGTALIASAEAGLVTAAIQPLFFGQARGFQEKWDMSMSAEIVGLSMLVGAGFGALVGGLSRRSGIQRASATAKAVRDMMDDVPVDVRPVMPVRVNFDDAARLAIGIGDETNLSAGVGKFLAAVNPALTAEDSAQAVLRVLLKPGFRRTAEEKALVGVLDITPEIREIARIADIPGPKRSKEEKLFVELFETGRLGEHPQWKQLMAERAGERELDFTVAKRDHEAPDVEATTDKNVNVPHETTPEELDIVAIRMRELDEAGNVTPDEKRALADVEEFSARTEKWADGWRDAAACLSKGVA